MALLHFQQLNPRLHPNRVRILSRQNSIPRTIQPDASRNSRARMPAPWRGTISRDCSLGRTNGIAAFPTPEPVPADKKKARFSHVASRYARSPGIGEEEIDEGLIRKGLFSEDEVKTPWRIAASSSSRPKGLAAFPYQNAPFTPTSSAVSNVSRNTILNNKSQDAKDLVPYARTETKSSPQRSVNSETGSATKATQLIALGQLLHQGLLNKEEFEEAKRELFAAQSETSRRASSSSRNRDPITAADRLFQERRNATQHVTEIALNAIDF